MYLLPFGTAEVSPLPQAGRTCITGRSSYSKLPSCKCMLVNVLASTGRSLPSTTLCTRTSIPVLVKRKKPGSFGAITLVDYSYACIIILALSTFQTRHGATAVGALCLRPLIIRDQALHGDRSPGVSRLRAQRRHVESRRSRCPRAWSGCGERISYPLGRRACGLSRRTTRRVDETARDRASASRKASALGRALVVKKASGGQAAHPS